ncbi:MAG: hypothetical protein HDT35_03540 [Clostridiales bacterium]|nr:hypothetical protein [Clostridiales bacterium]
MKILSNLEIEDRFLRAFECSWNETLEQYKCSQAQLNGGSRLRPLMVLWGYLATVDHQESADVEYIAKVAVSVELIHKGTILLDDWIDQDEARHGKKAFHVEFDPYYTVILALHMVSDSMVRLKTVLPMDPQLANNYFTCADLLAQTIFSMSKGALEELRLENNILNLEHIKMIARLETAEIIGNAMQLGYYAGGGTDLAISQLFKQLGDQFGYLFQAMNDLEAFSDAEALATHKGAANDDISISRKNLGVALLYNIARPADQKLILDRAPEIIYDLMQKYHILNFILKKTELYYDNIFIKLRKNAALSSEWIEGYIQFMNRMKQKAYGKLGVE